MHEQPSGALQYGFLIDGNVLPLRQWNALMMMAGLQRGFDRSQQDSKAAHLTCTDARGEAIPYSLAYPGRLDSQKGTRASTMAETDESQGRPLRFAPPSSVDTVAKDLLAQKLGAIEKNQDKDVIVLFGPIQAGVDIGIREAVERIEDHRGTALFVVDTLGGSVEVVERIVDVLRNRYQEVHFVVPDQAMSAGTVLVLSGDRIYMDSFSRLGPIDPQILSPDQTRYVSGLSYLSQYESMIKRGADISQAEMILLQKLDLAELDMYRLAKDLTIELLKKWLVQYKFRNWTKTSTRGIEVTQEMRVERANHIAEALNDQQRWGSHARGISSRILREQLELVIEDLEGVPELWQLIRDYFWFLMDYCNRNGFRSFIHSRKMI